MGLKEMEEEAAWRVSEGFKTGPVGESPVLYSVVVVAGEKTRAGWKRSGEMKGEEE